jgi:catechol 2,3-dioxygenase-like lactoylglutathione lyase family enzyme
MIEGLSHITFVVSNLDSMSNLLTTIFDASEVYSSGDKTFSVSKEKFLLINNVWIAIMEGQPLSGKHYNHVAFKIAEEEYDEYLARIRSLGLEVREDRSRVVGEGRSIYFYDYDNHLFELHTGTLDQRLAAYDEA